MQQQFPVLEMTCAACAVSVESMLKGLPGVKKAEVNYANHAALVEFDESITNPGMLQEAIRSIGYDLIIETENTAELQEAAQQNHYQQLKRRTIWAGALTIPVVVIGMFFMNMPYSAHLSLVLTAPVVFVFGRNFFVHAVKQARHGKATMDTLVALSTGIAFLFSVFNTFFPEFWHSRNIHPHVYYEAAAVIIVFISLGKLLEEKAKSNTSSAIRKLIGLQPMVVKVLDEGVEKEVAAASLRVGQIVIVKPGDKIAVDGVVTAGMSYVDESMITGEPIDVAKQKGDNVFAGTVNQKGSFHFTASKVGSDTLLANIIKMVQQAQGSKAPVQKLADKIAGIFVPIVLGIALLTFIVWMFSGIDNAFTHALLTSITVLVIACPCALGLATPTAIMVGVGKGAQHNILIKDAESLELAHKVNAVVLDKTGTITEGNPVVTDMLWVETDLTKQREYKTILYAIEAASEHPLAEAIAQYIKNDADVNISLDHFESITGKGLRAVFKNETYYVGNARLLSDHNVTIPDNLLKMAKVWQDNAKTVVYAASSQCVIASMAIADEIKPTAAHAIEKLQRSGIDVYMLTGDNAFTAQRVAEKVHIAQFEAGMLPSEKADYIKALQQKGKIVAMVGDGINDSQALAQADVSIAMGKGSDIAIDVAKMTLLTTDLHAILKALRLSRQTVNGIRQNLFWAFVYNVVGIPLAAGVLFPVNGFLLDPMIAGAAMALSSISVVLNSLRLNLLKL